MMQPKTSYTIEQVLALAPDAASAKAAKEQSARQRWNTPGCNAQSAWGLCQGSAQKPYQVQIDLSASALHCSCPSRKQPCKHALGLFLLLVGQPEAFTECEPPGWVTEWLASRQLKAEKAQTRKAEKSAAPDPLAQAKRQAKREANVLEGIDDLERWLNDLVHQGLAGVQGKPLSFWEAPAARLVDAQAPGLARRVRELSAIPACGEGWQERLLEQAAGLALLLAAYRRQERLPVEMQAHLRSLVGWTQDQATLLEMPGLRDRWLVVAQSVEEEARTLVSQAQALKVQRTWLWGVESQRPALVFQFAAPGQPLDTGLVPGGELDAELVFFPAPYPLRALVKTRHALFGQLQAIPGHANCQAAMQAYAAALAADPWLNDFPMPLQGVTPSLVQSGWLLQDADGRSLPVRAAFLRGWELLALSGGYPLDVFGVWDGAAYLPLSCIAEAGWIALGDHE